MYKEERGKNMIDKKITYDYTSSLQPDTYNLNYDDDDFLTHVYLIDEIYDEYDYNYTLYFNIVTDKRTNEDFLQISFDNCVYLNLNTRWSKRIIDTLTDNRNTLAFYDYHVDKESKAILKYLANSNSSSGTLSLKLYSLTKDTTFARLIKLGIISVICGD